MGFVSICVYIDSFSISILCMFILSRLMWVFVKVSIRFIYLKSKLLLVNKIIASSQIETFKNIKVNNESRIT